VFRNLKSEEIRRRKKSGGKQRTHKTAPSAEIKNRNEKRGGKKQLSCGLIKIGPMVPRTVVKVMGLERRGKISESRLQKKGE